MSMVALAMRPARLAKSAVIIRPATILRFHRALKDRKYRLLFSPKRRGKPGPGVWTFSDVSPLHSRPIGHWVVIDQFTRRIIGFGIQSGDVDGPTLCRMFNRAISTAGQPRYLSSDNDPLFNYHQWLANLRNLEIEEIKTIPYVPMSHPFVERLIGTIRREFLDHVLFWSSHDLERKLSEFKNYYNHNRAHSALPRDAPAGLAGEVQNPRAHLADYLWKTHCRRLFVSAQ